MRIEKECPCCGSVYTISFVKSERDDPNWDVQNETFDEDDGIYPEFCPFCGSHEDDEPPEDLDEDE